MSLSDVHEEVPPADHAHRSRDVDPWLVVVDIQHVFTDPASGWYAQGCSEAVSVITELQQHFVGRTVYTRFVRDPDEVGGWRDYYDAWPQFRLPPTDSGWELSMPVPNGAAVIDEPTFSKWTASLKHVIGDADVVLCGVATECCVLSTAFAAADEGRSVQVVADACAGASASVHEAALAVMMQASAPLITVVSSAQVVSVPR